MFSEEDLERERLERDRETFRLEAMGVYERLNKANQEIAALTKQNKELTQENEKLKEALASWRSRKSEENPFPEMGR